MSAAEPANPERAYLNTGAAGAVIDITKHRRRGGALQAAQGRWTMTTPPEPSTPSGDSSRQTALELFANDVETAFNAMRPPRTLSDDDTAAVFLVSLAIMERVLEATRARGIISAEQLDDLKATVAHLRDTPGLV
ncbi:hypothetical protein ACIQVL_48595 [Streptomyces sp. NPDC090499]|uniref:hypothetical protein n=1 Tax=Streptomyces sp. NPDC090499 TaxID=3365965 RepID=UPI0037FE7A00